MHAEEKCDRLSAFREVPADKLGAIADHTPPLIIGRDGGGLHQGRLIKNRAAPDSGERTHSAKNRAQIQTRGSFTFPCSVVLQARSVAMGYPGLHQGRLIKNRAAPDSGERTHSAKNRAQIQTRGSFTFPCSVVLQARSVAMGSRVLRIYQCRCKARLESSPAFTVFT